MIKDPTTSTTPATARFFASSRAQLESAIQCVDRRMMELTEEVEARQPGTTFGAWRYNHVHAISTEAEKINGPDFSPEDLPGLKLLFLAHDLGRPIERLKQLGGEKTVNHGVYSAEALAALPEFQGLPEGDKHLFLKAVRWHGERVVDLKTGSPEWRLTYCLRNHDKLDAFSQTLDYKMPFALSEIMSWFGLSAEERSELLVHEANALRLLADAFGPSMGPVDYQTYGLPQVGGMRLAEIMNRKLDPDNEAVRAAIEGRSTDFTKLKADLYYAAFFLHQAAMFFDIYDPKIVNMVRDKDLLGYRLRFIEKRCSPELFDAIAGSFNKVFIAYDPSCRGNLPAVPDELPR